MCKSTALFKIILTSALTVSACCSQAASVVRVFVPSVTLTPLSETFFIGVPAGGTLFSWGFDDVNPRVVQKFLWIPPLFIRTGVDFSSPIAGPVSITFQVKARANQAGGYQIRLLLQDKVTSNFVVILPSATLTTAYAIFNGVASGTLSNYVGTSGAMTGRIEVRVSGFSSTQTPSVSFEFANMIIT